METIEIIQAVVTMLTGLFALLTVVSKPFRNWLLNIKKEEKKEEEAEARQRETDKCLLRDRITSAYFKHHETKEIREYEFTNVASLYKQYKALGGNSFVDKIWKEMQEWTILP